MAKVYWDLEWTLQQQGFNYTYDKRLYDRLRDGQARPVREHLLADPDFQNRLARFLENHDEPRAAVTFPEPIHRASAVLTYLTPGLRFFHNGQFEARIKHISPHLIREPVEPVNENICQFYNQLLAVLKRDAVRNDIWQLLECLPAWGGNWTADCFIAFPWQGENRELILTIVNFAPNQSQCYVRLPFQGLEQEKWQFRDLLNPNCMSTREVNWHALACIWIGRHGLTMCSRLVLFDSEPQKIGGLRISLKRRNKINQPAFYPAELSVSSP